MIEKALVFIKDEVNSYLQSRTGSSNSLSLSNVTDNDGKTIISNLGLSLVNIEEEVIGKAQNQFIKTPGNKLLKVNPELHINLYILFSANFGANEGNYRESLKFISHIITFFQAKNVFSKNDYPNLDDSIEKLLIELCSVSFEQQNYLWGCLGSKYLPSVLYKVRMLVVQDMDILTESYEISSSKLIDDKS